MDILPVVLLCVFSVPGRAVFPGYFSYPAAAGPLFSNVIQQYPVQPAFAYSFYTPGSPIISAPAPLARSIYTEPDNIFHGYSFETEYESGGKSNVVFVTGPQANQILQRSIELFRTSLSPELEKLTGRSANSNDTKNSTVTETSSSASAKSSSPVSPIASHYHIQVHPANTSPLLAPYMPFQNLVSSFAYSITNEIAASNKDGGENAGEAQESMIHEVGANAVKAPPELLKNTSEKTSHKDGESDIHSTPQSHTETVTSTSTEGITTSTTSTVASTTATSESSSENSTAKPNPPTESNEVDESNTTTPGSDEIMETTSA